MKSIFNSLSADKGPWFNNNIFLLILSRLLRSIAQASLTIMLPIYLSKLGFSGVQIGFALTLSVIVGLFFSLFVGFYSDLYGKKIVILLLTITNIISLIGFLITTSYVPLLFFVAIGTIRGGGGGGAIGSAQQALIAENTTDKNRNEIFGRLSFFGASGSTIGYGLTIALPFLAGLYKSDWHQGYFLLIYVALLLYMTTFVITLFIKEDKQRNKRKSAFSLSWKLLGKFSLTNALNGLGAGFFNGPVLVYWFFIRYGVEADMISIIYVLANVARAIASIYASRIAKAFGTVKTIVGSRVFGATMLALMAFMPTFFFAGLCYLLRMMVVSVGIPLRQSFVMGQSKEEERASMAALSNLPQQVTSSVGPTVSGYFIDYSLTEAPIFLAAIFQFANAVLYWHFFKKSG